ncbi:MAG: hypothetical protein ABI851_03250 [Saprospiraceae bacterium]
MKTKLYFLLISCGFIFSTCCGTFLEVEEFCENQVFVESKTVPFEFIYKVNKVGKIIQAHIVTSETIQDGLGLGGSNFTIKRIELTSANIAYLREEDNASAAMFASLAVLDNTNILTALTKKDLFLPLFDVPASIFSKAININNELNNKGVEELKKILKDNFDLLNNAGITFVLLTEGSPVGTLTHFQLKVKMYLSLTYEICRYAPIGLGERNCD